VGFEVTSSATGLSGPLRRGHRRKTAILAVASLLLLGMGVLPASPATAQDKPNVVFIIADDLSFELMDRLPNVQSLLVNHGMSFTNMFAADPLCCPSRMSFLRGQYSHTTSEYNVDYTWGGWSHVVATGLENQTLPVWAAADGYYTAEQGKYLNWYNKASVVPPGWLDWRPMMKLGYLPNDAKHTYWSASVGGRIVKPAEYAPDWVSDQAVDAILSSGSRPLFMWTAYFDPHTPWTPPARYDSLAKATPCQGIDVTALPGFNESKTDVVDGAADKPRWVKRTAYSSSKVASLQTAYEHQCQSSLAMDDGIGRIVSALEVKDPGLQNTIIVFTSDQGLQNGAHMHAAKKVPWDESAKLPFVIRDDAIIGAASTNDALLTNVDFAPTIEELTGITGTPDCPTGGSIYESACEAHDGGFDGFSFAPLLTGGSYTPRDRFLIEHWDPSTLTSKVPTYCAVRSRTGLLVRYWSNNTSGADWEGYDLTADPDMLHSLVFSAAGTPATAVPQFRPGGQALYDSLVGSLHAACSPQPPEYPGF
jgi:N-acetylglucosamine-6-sulfatase